MVKIDFGSGYNPRSGYASCDFIPLPNLGYYFDGKHITNLVGEVDKYSIRNVLHHIKDLDCIIDYLVGTLAVGGTIEVIECRREHYSTNYLLDSIYYRWCNCKPEIWFSDAYRDYKSILKKSMILIEGYYDGEKEVSLWKKKL